MELHLPKSYDYKLYDYGVEIAYILDTIYSKYATNKRYGYGEPVPINMNTLQKIVGWERAKPAITEALDCWLIHTNGSYITGKRSRCYGLCNAFLEEPISKIIIEDKTIDRRLKKWRAKRNVEFEKLRTPVQELLFRDLQQLELDRLTDDDLWFYSEYDTTKYNPLIKAVEKIWNKQWFGKPCQNNRFHTNITNLQGNVRPHLHIAGKRLVLRDISCSQPLILCITAKNLTNIQYKYQPNTTTQTHHTPYPTKNFLSDLSKLQGQCESGQFYKIAATKIRPSRLDDTPEKHLAKVKIQLLQVIFDKPRTNCKYTTYYQTEFPHLLAVLNHTKKDDYRFLSNWLQQTESKIVIDETCGLLKHNHPNLPIITIHDCIGTVEGSEHIVEDALRETFGKYGLSPNIH